MADLGEIVRTVGPRYLKARPATPFQRKALRAIARCRTDAMEAVRAICSACGVEHLVFRSCRNRHCPRCQAKAREAWLRKREGELLRVAYFHVVFTVPEVLNAIALSCPEVFYGALFRAVGQALLDVGQSKLHAVLGAMLVLHTWGQNLSLHPHIHCVVPGGGLSLDGKRWIGVAKRSFLLPRQVLAKRFRGLFCNALRRAWERGQLKRLPSSVAADRAALEALLSRACRTGWVVYAKAPFGGPEQVLRYLSAYTHRIAISNRRILAFDGQHVTFRWRDYADQNRSKELTLDALEFLRRFLLHVLPDRFVRIRYIGFLGNRHRAHNLELVRECIGQAPPEPPSKPEPEPSLCPACAALRYSSKPVYAPRPPPADEGIAA
jgi:putative transposase/transposase-like zinc-binding protein